MLSAATLIAFARPHTLVATTMNVGLVFIHASSVTTQIDLLAAAYLLVSCLAYNIAVVGINQVYDIKVDKESKPYLPLASGKLTMKQAYTIITICSILAFMFLVASPSPFSLWLLMGFSLIIGMSYSIPYFDIRKSIIWPIVIIVSCRAILFNMIAFKYLTDSWPDTFIKNWMMYQTLYVTAIAIFKDIPDLEADIKYNRHTLAAMLGERNSKMVSVGLLMSAFFLLQPAGLFVACLLSSYLVYKVFVQKGLSEYQTYKVAWNLFYLHFALQIIKTLKVNWLKSP